MESIPGYEEDKAVLEEISIKSKMEGVSPQFAALDKAEEELIECLSEVRRLKSHYNNIKIARKDLTSETRTKVISSLIDEIGDILVDVLIGIPSVIPEIKHGSIIERVNKKINKYKRVITMIDSTSINS